LRDLIYHVKIGIGIYGLEVSEPKMQTVCVSVICWTTQSFHY